MPHTDDSQKHDEYERSQRRRDRIFKVADVVFWVAVSIIVVAFLLLLMALAGYFSPTFPVDAIPTSY